MSIFTYENRTFIFSGKITIYKASEIRKQILQAYSSEKEKNGDFFLDLSGVEKIDISVLQLIISLINMIKKENSTLKIIKDCKIFDSFLETVGVSQSNFQRVTN